MATELVVLHRAASRGGVDGAGSASSTARPDPASSREPSPESSGRAPNRAPALPARGEGAEERSTGEESRRRREEGGWRRLLPCPARPLARQPPKIPPWPHNGAGGGGRHGGGAGGVRRGGAGGRAPRQSRGRRAPRRHRRPPASGVGDGSRWGLREREGGWVRVGGAVGKRGRENDWWVPHVGSLDEGEK
jgi:hypothetical protein